MESFFSRYRNAWFLVAVLFAQLIGLATQVRVPAAGEGQGGSTRLLRVWTLEIVAPFQKLATGTGNGIRGLWNGYIDLRDVNRRNQDLQQQLDQERVEKARLQQDAEQGRRLQALLGFKEQYIARTIAAQVIGSSGTDLARVIYIDRGQRDGVAGSMAVITPDGVVGKISRADRNTSQVLLISDPQSGAGVILERLRVNGILKGSVAGYPEMQNVMADEKIQTGDRVITTGGDRVFPKGLPVGTVESFAPDPERDPFYRIKIRPAVNLGRLEEVLVNTELADRGPATNVAEGAQPTRAADLLAERLPSAKKKTTTDEQKPGGGSTAGLPASSAPALPKPAAPATVAPKPAAPAQTVENRTEPAKDNPR
jgi:rod shape-determining protein MreC